jgi:hypothetical protein
MVSYEAKTRLLRKRAAALSLPDGTAERVAETVRSAGMRLPGAAEALRIEWLNDLLAARDAGAFGLAARDPAAHLLSWAAERAKDPFHVTYRSVEAVARDLGPDAASRLVVAWRQEIAWAQRMRRYPNPRVATKAALFLREAEGAPGKLFERLAATYADAFSSPDYIDHPAHSMSDRDIRFLDHVPDFTPLFLRYASRAYAERLAAMARDKLEVLAARAAREEDEDRERAASRRSADVARRSPMRRMITVIADARMRGLSPNALWAAEEAFLGLLSTGEIRVPPGTGSPHARFLETIGDPSALARLSAACPPSVPDGDSLAWTVVHLGIGWLDGIPDGYRRMSERMRTSFESWQVEIAEERREAPVDPVSDFGFFLMERPS